MTTREEAQAVIEDFCLIVSLVRTATGDAGIAMDVSGAIKIPMWMLGGDGGMDWAQHQTVESTETPREMLARARMMLKKHYQNLPEVPPQGAMYRGMQVHPSDVPEFHRWTKLAFAKAVARIRRNEKEGVDPRSFGPGWGGLG